MHINSHEVTARPSPNQKLTASGSEPEPSNYSLNLYVSTTKTSRHKGLRLIPPPGLHLYSGAVWPYSLAFCIQVVDSHTPTIASDSSSLLDYVRVISTPIISHTMGIYRACHVRQFLINLTERGFLTYSSLVWPWSLTPNVDRFMFLPGGKVTTLQTMWNSLMVRGTPPWHSACYIMPVLVLLSVVE